MSWLPWRLRREVRELRAQLEQAGDQAERDRRARWAERKRRQRAVAGPGTGPGTVAAGPGTAPPAPMVEPIAPLASRAPARAAAPAPVPGPDSDTDAIGQVPVSKVVGAGESDRSSDRGEPPDAIAAAIATAVDVAGASADVGTPARLVAAWRRGAELADLADATAYVRERRRQLGNPAAYLCTMVDDAARRRRFPDATPRRPRRSRRPRTPAPASPAELADVRSLIAQSPLAAALELSLEAVSDQKGGHHGTT